MSDNKNETPAVNTEVTKKKGKLGLIIAIIAAAVAVVGIVLFFVFVVSGSGAGKKNKQIELGEKYLNDLDYDNAILAYKEAIKLDPRNEKAYLGLADAYRMAIGKNEEAGDYGKAMEYTDDAIIDMKSGVNNTGSEKIQNALDEFQTKKQELIDKLKEIDAQDTDDGTKDDIEKDASKEEIQDSSEAPEADVPQEEIPFSAWGTHDNPTLNAYMEGLGYIWIEEKAEEVLLPWGGKGYWGLSKDYYLNYAIYLSDSNPYLDPFDQKSLNVFTGMGSGPQVYYWTEGAYDSAALLKVAAKHAEMFNQFKQYFDGEGNVIDANGNYADGYENVNADFCKLRDEFWAYCDSQ